jgi:hypothetical protein
LTLQFSGRAITPFLEGGCSTVKGKETLFLGIMPEYRMSGIPLSPSNKCNLLYRQAIENIHKRIDLPFCRPDLHKKGTQITTF